VSPGNELDIGASCVIVKSFSFVIEVGLPVIARFPKETEAISTEWDCFVASLLAMTRRSSADDETKLTKLQARRMND
jgi:hypothetical protein